MPPKSTCAPGASLSQTPVGDGRWHHTYETRWNFSAALKLKKKKTSWRENFTCPLSGVQCERFKFKEDISLFAHAIARTSDA